MSYDTEKGISLGEKTNERFHRQCLESKMLARQKNKQKVSMKIIKGLSSKYFPHTGKKQLMKMELQKAKAVFEQEGKRKQNFKEALDNR